MNSCHCNSKSLWKRNLSLTGYSSLQWNSWCPLIIDLLHTVIILEHNYDIEIVTWKHKPSLNNYISMFLFLDISHWFSFWDTSAVFFFQLTTVSVPIWDCSFRAGDAGEEYTPQVNFQGSSVSLEQPQRPPSQNHFLGQSVSFRCFSRPVCHKKLKLG